MPPISVERRRFDSGLAVVSFQNKPVEATRHEVWLIPASPIPVCAVPLRTEVRDVHPPVPAGVDVVDQARAPRAPKERVIGVHHPAASAHKSSQ